MASRRIPMRLSLAILDLAAALSSLQALPLARATSAILLDTLDRLARLFADAHPRR